MALGPSSAFPANFEPKSGNVYLVEERRPKVTFDLFDQALSSGFSGLVVTRDFPKRLLSEKELGACKVVWLTNMVGEGRINPTAIGIIMGQMRAFIESNPKSVLLLDGLEYLISLNTYDRMLQFMHQIRDLVVTNECVMLVPIDPRTVGQRELALLERSMEPLIPRADAESSDEALLGTDDQGVLKLMDAHPR